MVKRIGFVGLVIKRLSPDALKVYKLLAGHEALIIGRTEVACPPGGITAIALVIEATTDEVGALTGKLGQLPDVRVKTSLI